MKRISAKNPEELLNHLRALSESVDERGKGQVTAQTESCILSRLGLGWVDLGLINFPVEILRSDRPDVLLEMSSGSVGVELTEAVPPAYAQADAIRNQYYPDAQVSRSVFTWGAHFTAQQIHSHLARVGSELTGPPWHGDSVEREWASSVNGSIKSKAVKLNKPGFAVHDRNWLCIYTSSPGPALKVAHGAKFLEFPSPDCGKRHFDTVFILASRTSGPGKGQQTGA